jgi:hypothetical protein
MKPLSPLTSLESPIEYRAHVLTHLQELMAYVGAAFGSANADVRAAALRVAVVASEAAGAAPVRRLLPQGMNPKMKEQVEHALGLEASPAQPAGEVTSVARCQVPAVHKRAEALHV